MKKVLLIFLILQVYNSSTFGQESHSIITHSHNDYEQDQPLRTALILDFESIEIDILMCESRLVVTHNSFNLDRKPTIEDLYLDPLYQIPIDKHSIRWLLIDIKKYNKKTLDLLHNTLIKYSELFQNRTTEANDNLIQVILSGRIPRNEIANNPKYKYFFLDGRLTDLEQNLNLKYTPLISSNITAFTSWRRNHCLKPNELDNVKSMLDRVHDLGIKFRFWNTDDNEIIWNQLLDLRVDVISVDNLQKLSEFLN